MLSTIFFMSSLISIVILLYYCEKKKKNNLFIKSKDDDAIIILGCDSGIGLELAKYFYKITKYKIICCFLSLQQSKGYEELLELKNNLHDNNRIILIKLDLTKCDDIDNIVKSIDIFKRDKIFTQLLALINNAGIMTYGEFDWLTWEHIEKQININLIGTIRLTRAILPYIIESKGRIINVSSVNDSTVFPGTSIYSATKSALSTFSRGLGYELRKFNVNVITMRLGDFARLTNIMSKHEFNQCDMWKEMSQKKKDIYKEFFPEFNGHLLRNYGMTSPRDFENSSLFNDFKKAILLKNPPSIIICAPITFRIFYFIIELMPISLQYYLLDFLVQYGFGWKPPQVVT